MGTRFRELWRTPGVQFVCSLWAYLLLVPACGYVLGGWQGVAVSAALLAGLPVGFVVLWVAYEFRCAWYRIRCQYLGALCPYCVQPLEGRRACANCAAEAPAITYLLGGLFSRVCTKCDELTRPPDRPFVCFQPECDPKTTVNDFASVPGNVLLLLVHEKAVPPRIGVPLEGEEKSTYAGPLAACIVLEAAASTITPDVLKSVPINTLVRVWVEEGVIEHKPDALVVLEESVPAQKLKYLFAGDAPLAFPGAESQVSLSDLDQLIRKLCGLEGGE